MRCSLVLIIFMLCLAPTEAAENLSDHESFCSQNPAQPCIEYIRQNLTVLPRHSSAWFKVKSYELDYLFDKHLFTTLSEQTSELLSLANTPPGFSTQLYFYHAKALFIAKQPEQAKHYANLAMQQIKGAFDSFGSPLRAVELANLYYSLADYTTADAILNDIAGQFSKSKDPLFWFEWYANKALILHKQQDLAGAAALREKSLARALEMKHHGKIIIGYGNLARTQQLLGQYQQAYSNYELSLAYMTEGNDDVTRAIYLLRMAEICWQRADFAKAVIHIRQIDTALLSEFHLTTYHMLLQAPELSALLAPQ